jgi:hypothetical protein
MSDGKLPVTGMSLGVTAGGMYVGLPTIAVAIVAVGVALVLVSAVWSRHGFRRGRTIGTQ